MSVIIENRLLITL